MQSKIQTQRDVSVDLLKSIAVFGVIIIHMCGEGYSYPVASFNWGSTVFWGCLMRGSVPLFWMCSGVLLLDPNREMTIKKVYLRHILRIVIAMLVWSMAYKIYDLLAQEALNPSNGFRALKEVLLFKQEFHMYFIHIMIVLYMFLPLTRVFIKHASKNEILYALGLWFVLGVVYQTVNALWPIRFLSGILSQWPINMTYASIGYSILGYYLAKYPLSVKWNCLLFGLGFASVFGLTVYGSVKNGALYENALGGMFAGVALLAAGQFGLCYNIKNRLNGKAAAVFAKISKASFCIYLVHIFVMHLFEYVGVGTKDFLCLISIPVLSAVSLLISFAVYCVLSRIPFVNRWLV